MKGGTKSSARSSIDPSGRLVIPKRIREEAGLHPGKPLRISLRDGRVEIEPMPAAVRIEQRGRVAVAVPLEPLPPLTTEQVERTRQSLRGDADDG